MKIEFEHQIIELTRQFLPLSTKNLYLTELSIQHQPWYSTQLLQPYFSRNIVNKLPTGVTPSALTGAITIYTQTLQTNPSTLKEHRLVIHSKETDTPIGGMTSTWDPCTKIISIGYWLVPYHQNRGYMGEILPVYVANLLRAIPSDYILQVEIFDTNKASLAIATKAGFKPIETTSQKSKHKHHKNPISILQIQKQCK